MKKFLAPIILFIVAAGVIAYLFMDVSSSGYALDADAYLQARSQIDSLEIALWENSDNPEFQDTIRAQLDAYWEYVSQLRAGSVNVESSNAQESSGGLSGEAIKWIVGGAILIVICLILLAALAHRKKVLTQRMEAIKREQRFREPVNGLENEETIAPTSRPQAKSIIDEANEFAETKSPSEELEHRPQLRPTAKERITSAMQSLSDVLRSPRGLSRERTMKLRAQSHNVTGDPNLQGSHPLQASRFDKEAVEKTKILQMSRRGFPASAIASQLKITQEQVEAVIKEAQDLG